MLFAASIAQFQCAYIIVIKKNNSTQGGDLHYKVMYFKWFIFSPFPLYFERIIGVLFFLGNFNSRRTRVSMMLSTIDNYSLFISISFFLAKESIHSKTENYIVPNIYIPV